MKKNKSMLESAFEAINKAPGAMAFTSIYAEVQKDLEMSEEEAASKIGEFYTDLTLDGRFVILTDNNWDLRSRHTYDKVHMDMNEVYSEIELKDDDAVTQEEEAEYNAEVNGKTYDENLPAPEEEEETDHPKDDTYFG